MRNLFLLFVLLPFSAIALPICATMDREKYDVVKSKVNTSYHNSCEFHEPYRKHIKRKVCYEDSSVKHDDGRIERIRTVTCDK